MRKGWFVVAACALLVVGALVALALPRGSPVTRAAFDRIEVGMSLAEVEKILGGPAGDYSTEPRFVLIVDLGGSASMRGGTSYRWDGDEGVVFLGVNDAGCVCWKQFVEASRLDVGPVELWRWRFERWWDSASTGPRHTRIVGNVSEGSAP